MSPEWGRYDQAKADADIAVHAALAITHGATDALADQADIAVHAAILNAHTQDIYQLVRTGEYLIMPWGYPDIQPITADTLYASPLWIPRAITADRLAIQVSTAGASGKAARLGIYNDGTNLYPGTLLLDAGTVAVDSTGVKAITISQALTKGLYWVVVVSNGAPEIRGQRAIFSPIGFITTPSLEFSDPCALWQVAFTYAALPDPFTASGTKSTFRALHVPPRVLSLD